MFGLPHHFEDCQITSWSLAQTTPVCAGWNIALRGADRISERWRQHRAEVHSATVVPSPYALCPCAVPAHSDDVDVVQEWHPSRTDLANILVRVDGSKALGPDGISATVLRAGGHVLLQHLHDIISASISQCRFPVPWRGGR